MIQTAYISSCHLSFYSLLFSNIKSCLKKKIKQMNRLTCFTLKSRLEIEWYIVLVILGLRQNLSWCLISVITHLYWKILEFSEPGMSEGSYLSNSVLMPCLAPCCLLSEWQLLSSWRDVQRSVCT